MQSTLKNNTSKQLLWIGMIGITMFFAGLTSAYIVRAADSNWMQFNLPNWFWVSTFSIIISSRCQLLLRLQISKFKSTKTVCFLEPCMVTTNFPPPGHAILDGGALRSIGTL